MINISYKKKIENICYNKKLQGSLNITDVTEYIKTLYNPDEGVNKITEAESYELLAYAKEQMKKPSEKVEKALYDIIKAQLKICREFGCRYNADKTEIYNPETNKKVVIAELKKCKNERAIICMLNDIKKY